MNKLEPKKDIEVQRVAVLLNGPISNDARVFKTIQSLSEIGFSVDLFCYGYTPDDMKLLPLSVQINSVAPEVGWLANFYSRTLFTRAHISLYRSLLEHSVKYDIIWSNDLPCLVYGAKYADKVGAKLIYDSHEIFLETINQFFPNNTHFIKRYFHYINRKLMQFLGKYDENKYGAKADLVITVNESLKSYFHDLYKWKNIQVLMNAPVVRENKKHDLHELLQIDKANKILLYQGGLNEGRGLRILIHAMAALPKFYHLLVLGDGFIMPELKDQVKKLNLISRVHFLGAIKNSELSSYTQAADLGVNLLENYNLSKYLASPNKLFEYIHARIPVICSDTPENRKVIDQFEVGAITDNSLSDVCKKIIFLVEEFKLEDDVVNSCIRRYNWNSQFEQVKSKVLSLVSD